LVAERNVQYVKEILKTTGVSPERVQMFNCSAAEGQKFQNEATRISEQIANLGSNPIKDNLKSEKEKKTSEDKKKK
jgi:coenzyme F420-reducing hydrogenase delta subunit